MLPKKPRRPGQWNPAISVKPRVYDAIKARAAQLGIPMAVLVERIVFGTICSICHRAEVFEPGAIHCGSDACAHEARAS